MVGVLFSRLVVGAEAVLAGTDALALVALLRAAPTDALVQHFALQRLAATDLTAANLDAAAGAGALDVVLACVALHADDADVMAAACHAVSRLTTRHTANQKRAGLAGLGATLVDVMNQHPAVAAVQHYALEALDNLTVVPANRARVAAAHGRVALVAVRHAHPNLERIQEVATRVLARLPQ